MNALEDTPVRCDGSPGLSDVERIIVIVFHYAVFPISTYAMYALHKKMDVIQLRIYSPFILMVAFLWSQLGMAFEIGNHHYTADWELKVSVTDLINGSFSFCNFGAQHIQAIALKKKGVPLFRFPNFGKGILNGLLDMIAIVGDLFLLITTIIQPILYSKLGRLKANNVLIPASSVAGIFSLVRLWQNLGPNKYTFWGGTLFLAFALCGVFSNALYPVICNEFIHVAIASSFNCSMIPFVVALWHAELPGQDLSNDEVSVAREIKLCSQGERDTFGGVKDD